MSATATRRTVAPAVDSFAWVVPPVAGRGVTVGAMSINGTDYAYREEVANDHPDLASVIDLTKYDGTSYRLTVGRDGVLECDCPDAVYRGRACKHCRGCVALRIDV